MGIKACNPGTKFVVIHDGIRPFISEEMINIHAEAVLKHKAINTYIPSADTIIHLSADEKVSIPKRDEYLRGQTPQTFEFDLINRAHQSTKRTASTDDCSLVLDLHHPIFLVRGDEKNIKITTAVDLELSRLLYANDLKKQGELVP